MSETTASLRSKIGSAVDLQSVVRTMKALSASGVGQYENSVRALADYYRTVQLGLGACLRESGLTPLNLRVREPAEEGAIGVIVFGSDQGLVGQFNDMVADSAIQALGALSGKVQVWAVGERVHARLQDAHWPPLGPLTVPVSVGGISALVGQILVETETPRDQGEFAEVHLFYNRRAAATVYEPFHQKLLPLDEAWRRDLAGRAWPTKNLPEVVGGGVATLRLLIREYLFISLFRACAESLASENASRLAAMQRADRNIDELREELGGTFHRLRQAGIDAELFDVIAGFDALSLAAD